MLAPKAIGAGLYLRRRQLPLEELGRALLGEQAGLEIEPGREPHIGVGGPRVAIEAAVLAAAVGVDRAVERDVGRVVAGDDRLGLLPGHLGRERLGRFVLRPAVVERLAPLGFRNGRMRWSPRRARAEARRAGCVRRSRRGDDAGQGRRIGRGSGSWRWTIMAQSEQIMNKAHSRGSSPRQGQAVERSYEAR